MAQRYRHATPLQDTPPGLIEYKHRQVSWLADHHILPPSRTISDPVAYWKDTGRLQLRGQLRICDILKHLSRTGFPFHSVRKPIAQFSPSKV